MDTQHCVWISWIATCSLILYLSPHSTVRLNIWIHMRMCLHATTGAADLVCNRVILKRALPCLSPFYKVSKCQGDPPPFPTHSPCRLFIIHDRPRKQIKSTKMQSSFPDRSGALLYRLVFSDTSQCKTDAPLLTSSCLFYDQRSTIERATSWGLCKMMHSNMSDEDVGGGSLVNITFT